MIAAVITSTTLNEVKKDISAAAKLTSLVEVRLDYLQKLDESILSSIIKHQPKVKKIITIRKKEEGGKRSILEKKRISSLKKAMYSDCT